MNKNKIYYLKKYHKPLITSKAENTKAVIDVITNDMIIGHYLDGSDTTFNCCKGEFSKIFTGKCSDEVNQI